MTSYELTQSVLAFPLRLRLLPPSDGIHWEEREAQRAENWHPHVHKGRKSEILFKMESKTLLLLEMCQTLGFPNFQNNKGMRLLFSEQLIYKSLMANGTPCVSLTVSFSWVRQLLASPATSWPMPCGKGPSRPTNHAKKWEFILLLLVTPPEGSIIWFGKGRVITEDTDTCYLHMSYVCISLQCFDLTMEDIMDHIPYFSNTACSTDLFEPLRKLIDHDFQRKPRGRSAHCRSGQWQPQSIFHGGCLRCSVCVKAWCDALQWPMLPIVLKDYLASSEKVNKVHCISLKGPFERIVLRPILETRWNIYSLRCLSGCSLLLKGDGQ